MRRMVVFVSSTFRDMRVERDRLLNGAFRKLEYEAGLKGIGFSAIDLRWGITSSTPEVETIRRCLDLVGECKPCFLALVGGRYGWTPPKSHLDALSPPLREVPADGTSVTELEILRFFEQAGGEPEDPKGLFLVLRDPAFETPRDRKRLAKLRSRIDAEAASGRAEVHEYGHDEAGLARMDAHVLGFFRARMDDLPGDGRSDGFPASTLPRIPARSIRAWPEYAHAMQALAAGRTVVVDSPQALLRTAFIDRVARDHAPEARGDARPVFLHAGAEGILSGQALARTLEERLGPVGPGSTQAPLALDALDALADWTESGDVDSLALSRVLVRILEQAQRGRAVLLGGDWSARTAVLHTLPDADVIRIDRDLLGAPGEVAAYFADNFAKELTDAQASAILVASSDGRLGDCGQLLLCDRIRRCGDLKPEGVPQDEFLLDRIRQSAPDDEGTLVSSELSALMDNVAADRIPVLADAIAILCASRHGVSMLDIQEMGSGAPRLTTDEWALLRAHLGPLAMGTIARVRCADDAARDRVLRWLDERSAANGRRRLRDWIIERAANARGLEELLDPARVMAIDLRWLMPDARDRGLHGFLWALLDPALWLSLAYHDWLLADREIQAMFEAVPAAEAGIAHEVDPWPAIDRLGRLVAASRHLPEAWQARLAYALDKAELVTNGPEQLATGALKERVLACGFSQRRGIVISRGEVSNATLGWSLDWALALSRSDRPYPARTVERAWVEFAFLFALWMRAGAEGRGSHARMGWALQLVPRLRDAEVPDAISGVLGEIEAVHADDPAGRRTPGGLVDAWSTRLREWVRARKDLPSCHSELMARFPLLESPSRGTG